MVQNDEECSFYNFIPDTFYPIERLQNFVHLGNVKHYAKGDIVFLPGIAIGKMGYVLSGKIKIYEKLDENHEKLIGMFGKHSLMGTIHSEIDELFAIALEESSICFFSKQQIFEIFRQDQEMIIEILKNYASKANYFMKQAFEREIYYPKIRILRLLRNICLTKGKLKNDIYEVNISISQKCIAEITGTHYVTVSKVLGYLRKNKILDKTRGKIVLYDLDRLDKLINNMKIEEDNC